MIQEGKMRTMTAMLLGAVVALTAQELPPNAAKRMAEVKAQMEEIEIGSAGGQTFRFVTGQILNGNPVKGQPYSAEAVTESTQTLADGNKIVNRSSSMIYRDSEGRERREETIGKLGAWNADGGAAKAIFISDPVAKTSFSLDEKSPTAIKMPAPLGIPGGKGATPVFTNSRPERGRLATGAAGAVPGGVGGAVGVGAGPGTQVFHYETRAAGPAGPEPRTEKLGSETIEGVVADHTRTTITIPAGQIGNDREINIVDERWYSPELQVTVMSKHSDPRMGETVYKLTNVSRAEPTRSLFEVPPDYSISDGQAMKRMITKEEEQQ